MPNEYIVHARPFEGLLWGIIATTKSIKLFPNPAKKELTHYHK